MTRHAVLASVECEFLVAAMQPYILDSLLTREELLCMAAKLMHDLIPTEEWELTGLNQSVLVEKECWVPLFLPRLIPTSVPTEIRVVRVGDKENLVIVYKDEDTFPSKDDAEQALTDALTLALQQGLTKKDIVRLTKRIEEDYINGTIE